MGGGGGGQRGNSFSPIFLCSGKRFDVELEPSVDKREHVQMSQTHCDRVSGRITAQSQTIKVQHDIGTHNSICSSF